MTKYNDLTQEQKESITKKLRYLFEGCKEIQDLDRVDFPFCGITAITSKNYETELCDKCKNKIKGFQEGLKTAIKIIDEEIEKIIRLKLNIEERTIRFKDYTSIKKEVEKETSIRIEELKKQKEHLEWESKLE